MPRKSNGRKKSQPTLQAVVGVGLDADDGQKRITRTEEMVLFGGSQETHERMQETAIRFGEALEKRGKKLPEIPVRDAIQMLLEAHARGE